MPTLLFCSTVLFLCYDKVLEKHESGLKGPFTSAWANQTPIPKLLESVNKMNSLLKSGCASVVALSKIDLSFTKVVSHSFVQLQVVSTYNS